MVDVRITDHTDRLVEAYDEALDQLRVKNDRLVKLGDEMAESAYQVAMLWMDRGSVLKGDMDRLYAAVRSWDREIV